MNDLTVTFECTTDLTAPPRSVRWFPGFKHKTRGGAVVTHTYPAPGTYTARLVVADNEGRSIKAFVTMTFPERPVKDGPVDRHREGDNVSFEFRGPGPYRVAVRIGGPT